MDRGIDFPGPGSFAIQDRDLDRISRRIGRTRTAEDLTELARHFVRGRLRYGPERGEVVRHPISERERVGVWDPAGAWQEGDCAIFAVPVYRDRVRVYSPCVGDVTKVQGQGIVVRLDGHSRARFCGTAPRRTDDDVVADWRRSVEGLVEVLRDRGDEPSRVDYVFWRYGEGIVTQLRSALRHDVRFLSLAGRWFVRSATDVPTHDQLARTARAMLSVADRPLAVEELLRWVSPPLSSGDAGMFGLAAGLRQRPDLFADVDTGPRPRWVLAGPPPGSYTARYGAFDPTSFDLLCEPGDPLAPEIVRRLWELDLLSTVVVR